jgi:choline-sulfatase
VSTVKAATSTIVELHSNRAGVARVVALLAAVLSGLAAVWWRADVRSPVNVIVITLDTTRADRLTPYGFMDASMPALERLAREGVVFDQATSVAPLTLPAHASLFTGLFPPAHGVRDNGDAALAASHTTLAEILRGQGFCTGAFVSSVVLDPDRGLAQGFGQYLGVPRPADGTAARGQRRGDEVIGDAIKWLDDAGACPLFLWAHLYDPHRPYEPPEPFRARHFDPYVGEIAFADSQIGGLLDALEHRQLLERTLVLVAGDHGESLGEHGEEDHGIFVYESVLRVPLIIRLPRIGRDRQVAPRRIGDVVRLVDVMPTVLDLLGIPEPPMDGVSLLGRMRGTQGPLDLEAYAESMYPARFGWSPLKTLRDGRFKMIDAPRAELYDLERDPFETRNILEERRTLAQAMQRRLDFLAGPGAASADAVSATELPADARERLQALGYVGSAAVVNEPRTGGRPDPKDCMPAPGGRTTSSTTTSGRLSVRKSPAWPTTCSPGNTGRSGSPRRLAASPGW